MKDLVIGQHAIFIREELNKQSVIVQRRYEGVIIDKFIGREKYEGKYYVLDYYLVKFATGIVTRFQCSECVQIITPTPEQSTLT